MGAFVATTPEQGRKYAERLIKDACDKRPCLMERVVYDLSEPRREADAVARGCSSSYSIDIRGETVELRSEAARAFADAIWKFVSTRAKHLDESALEAFQNDRQLPTMLDR